jgi:ABC-type multidrug transport system fused ATPase/permease subunit
MSSPVTSYTPPVTSASDDEVLVRVEGVSKKFCRSLKKSLWYGVCDIASELNPFGRVERMPNGYKNLTTIEHLGRCENEQLKVGPKGERAGAIESKDTECTEAEAKVRLAGQAGAEFSNPSASRLARGSENTSLIRAANNLRSSGDQTGSDSATAKIGEICGKNEGLRPGEFWAVRDVSFELRRGECLGLIGHNGAGKTTLLKMLNGLIKPDAGSITMRGRVVAHFCSTLGSGRSTPLPINGSVLGLTKKEPMSCGYLVASCG